ncbi:MAG: flagellar basal body-associated protein FliL [Qingshengfaniella sp.]
MAEPEPATETEERKPSLRLPLLIGVVLGVAGGAGGFFAAKQGLLPLPFLADAPEAETAVEPEIVLSSNEKPVFVPITPIMVTVAGKRNGAVRFEANLEVAPQARESVTEMMPRIVDVLNGYLRALELNDLNEPAALIRLRAQMLRRIQTVTGPGQVRDLLVTQFLLT